MYILQRAQSFIMPLYNFVAFITSQSPVDSTAENYLLYLQSKCLLISSDIFALADQDGSTVLKDLWLSIYPWSIFHYFPDRDSFCPVHSFRNLPQCDMFIHLKSLCPSVNDLSPDGEFCHLICRKLLRLKICWAHPIDR